MACTQPGRFDEGEPNERYGALYGNIDRHALTQAAGNCACHRAAGPMRLAGINALAVPFALLSAR